jgi:hypothetical protein
LSKSDPAFVKAARQSSSAKPENLEKRRLDFQQEYMILQALVGKIQGLNSTLHETKDPDAKMLLEREIGAYSNLANLKGLAGLYEGFALLSDLLSIRSIARDENDKPILTDKGEKIYVRTPILWDVAAILEESCDVQLKSHNILYKMGLKQGILFVAQKDAELAPVKLDKEAPVGVPESDLRQAEEKPTDAQVDKFVKGDAK